MLNLRVGLLVVAAMLFLSFRAAAAEPSLTIDVADRATRYMEWMLDVTFGVQQQQRYQRMLNDSWHSDKPDAAKTIVIMARAFDEVSALDAKQRDQVRSSKQSEFIRTLESSTSENSRWLLTVYKQAHSLENRPAETQLPIAATRVSGPFLGKWKDGYVSSIQYKNAYTGVPAPTNGRTFSYEFRADGTYSFTGLMQTVSYNCTTSIFSNESGTYTLNGEVISLNPESNPYEMRNNCAPSSNHVSPGKLIPRSYCYRVVIENGRRYLEMQSNGSSSRFAESQ